MILDVTSGHTREPTSGELLALRQPRSDHIDLDTCLLHRTDTCAVSVAGSWVEGAWSVMAVERDCWLLGRRGGIPAFPSSTQRRMLLSSRLDIVSKSICSNRCRADGSATSSLQALTSWSYGTKHAASFSSSSISVASRSSATTAFRLSHR